MLPRPDRCRARALLVPLALACGCADVATTSDERFTASGELIALSGGRAGAPNACFTCHGLDGRGDGAGSPRLAALDAGYLERQLQAFADGRRRHAQMEWIARRLAPGQRRAVALHYAAMPFVAATPAAVRPVPPLYALGDPARGVPACATCHGEAGQGVGPANPPLAGQSAAYLAGQLEKWRRSERRNDPGNVMLAISRRLSRAEAEAVAAYAATLVGDPPNPGSRAAYRAARRADSRNGASAPPRHGRE